MLVCIVDRNRELRVSGDVVDNDTATTAAASI